MPQVHHPVDGLRVLPVPVRQGDSVCRQAWLFVLVRRVTNNNCSRSGALPTPCSTRSRRWYTPRNGEAYPHFVAATLTHCYGTMAVLQWETLITMLRWTLTFLVIAIVAGVLGFTGISSAAAGIAKVIFFIFLALLVGSILFGASLFKTS